MGLSIFHQKLRPGKATKMLSEDKYCKHPSVKFATIICKQITFKEHKPSPLWHTSTHWLKLHRWQQPFFSWSQLQLMSKRLSQGSQHYVSRKHFFPTLKTPAKQLHCSREKSCRERVALSTRQIPLSVPGATATAKGKLWSPQGWQGTSGESSPKHSRSEPCAERDTFSAPSELLFNSRSTYSLNKCIHLFEQHCETCSHQQLKETYRTNELIYDYPQYIILHATLHLQTQAFLGVLWWYFHQATVTVRRGL